LSGVTLVKLGFMAHVGGRDSK